MMLFLTSSDNAYSSVLHNTREKFKLGNIDDYY